MAARKFSRGAGAFQATKACERLGIKPRDGPRPPPIPPSFREQQNAIRAAKGLPPQYNMDTKRNPVTKQNQPAPVKKTGGTVSRGQNAIVKKNTKTAVVTASSSTVTVACSKGAPAKGVQVEESALHRIKQRLASLKRNNTPNAANECTGAQAAVVCVPPAAASTTIANLPRKSPSPTRTSPHRSPSKPRSPANEQTYIDVNIEDIEVIAAFKEGVELIYKPEGIPSLGGANMDYNQQLDESDDGPNECLEGNLVDINNLPQHGGFKPRKLNFSNLSPGELRPSPYKHPTEGIDLIAGDANTELTHATQLFSKKVVDFMNSTIDELTGDKTKPLSPIKPTKPPSRQFPPTTWRPTRLNKTPSPKGPHMDLRDPNTNAVHPYLVEREREKEIRASPQRDREPSPKPRQFTPPNIVKRIRPESPMRKSPVTHKPSECEVPSFKIMVSTSAAKKARDKWGLDVPCDEAELQLGGDEGNQAAEVKAIPEPPKQVKKQTQIDPKSGRRIVSPAKGAVATEAKKSQWKRVYTANGDSYIKDQFGNIRDDPKNKKRPQIRDEPPEAPKKEAAPTARKKGVEPATRKTGLAPAARKTGPAQSKTNKEPPQVQIECKNVDGKLLIGVTPIKQPIAKSGVSQLPPSPKDYQLPKPISPVKLTLQNEVNQLMTTLGGRSKAAPPIIKITGSDSVMIDYDKQNVIVDQPIRKPGAAQRAGDNLLIEFNKPATKKITPHVKSKEASPMKQQFAQPCYVLDDKDRPDYNQLDGCAPAVSEPDVCAQVVSEPVCKPQGKPRDKPWLRKRTGGVSRPKSQQIEICATPKATLPKKQEYYRLEDCGTDESVVGRPKSAQNNVGEKPCAATEAQKKTASPRSQSPTFEAKRQALLDEIGELEKIVKAVPGVHPISPVPPPPTGGPHGRFETLVYEEQLLDPEGYLSHKSAKNQALSGKRTSPCRPPVVNLCDDEDIGNWSEPELCESESVCRPQPSVCQAEPICEPPIVCEEEPIVCENEPVVCEQSPKNKSIGSQPFEKPLPEDPLAALGIAGVDWDNMKGAEELIFKHLCELNKMNTNKPTKTTKPRVAARVNTGNFRRKK